MQTLIVGTLAPALDLERVQGGRKNLRDFQGKRVLVAFLRNAECAVCNLWVANTSRRAAAWREQGLEVVAVFESTPEKLRAQLGERCIPFDVLADPDGAAHDAFGSRTDAERVQAVIKSGGAEHALEAARAAGFTPRMEEGANFFRLPAEVLVNADGTIAHAHVCENVADHLAQEAIDRFARGDSP